MQEVGTRRETPEFQPWPEEPADPHFLTWTLLLPVGITPFQSPGEAMTFDLCFYEHHSEGMGQALQGYPAANVDVLFPA